VRSPRALTATRVAEADEHLRAAEDAFQRGKPLRQFAEADQALKANPRSVRAKYLYADALIKSGDLDNGCKALAELKQNATARARARAAGCPGD
jgi:thioredoxin-like negative regulator of GroEL